MEKINAYRTKDGALFDNAVQAARHAESLVSGDVIEEFLNSELNRYQGRAQREIARSTVINWQLWKTHNEIK